MPDTKPEDDDKFFDDLIQKASENDPSGPPAVVPPNTLGKAQDAAQTILDKIRAAKKRQQEGGEGKGDNGIALG